MLLRQSFEAYINIYFLCYQQMIWLTKNQEFKKIVRKKLEKDTLHNHYPNYVKKNLCIVLWNLIPELCAIPYHIKHC